MKTEFNLHKMLTVHADPVQYSLKAGSDLIVLNDLIGKEIQLKFNNKIYCIHCGKQTKTSFGQGFCYPCFISVPEAEDCVLRPELCTAHMGHARDMEYAKDHCLIDHYVYMALSGGLKVGVTRFTQKPVRWIDQGASHAIIVAKTPNRFIAGSIEVALKHHFHDKTNWRKMLSSEGDSDFNLLSEKQKALGFLHSDFKKYEMEDNEITALKYPVSSYPTKIKSVGFDKQVEISGILSGIKGQYLLFTSGEVLNIRKHGGYQVEFSY